MCYVDDFRIALIIDVFGDLYAREGRAKREMEWGTASCLVFWTLFASYPLFISRSVSKREREGRERGDMHPSLLVSIFALSVPFLVRCFKPSENRSESENEPKQQAETDDDGETVNVSSSPIPPSPPATIPLPTIPVAMSSSSFSSSSSSSSASSSSESQPSPPSMFSPRYSITEGVSSCPSPHLHTPQDFHGDDDDDEEEVQDSQTFWDFLIGCLIVSTLVFLLPGHALSTMQLILYFRPSAPCYSTEFIFIYLFLFAYLLVVVFVCPFLPPCFRHLRRIPSRLLVRLKSALIGSVASFARTSSSSRNLSRYGWR